MISLNGSSVARRGRCCVRQFLRLQQHGTPICDSSLAAASKKYRTVSNETFSPIEETMTESRMNRFASSFKRRVAAAAMCGEAGSAELAQRFSVCSSQVSSWKRQSWMARIVALYIETCVGPAGWPEPRELHPGARLLRIAPSSAQLVCLLLSGSSCSMRCPNGCQAGP